MGLVKWRLAFSFLTAPIMRNKFTNMIPIHQFRNRSRERQNVMQIHLECGVDILDERFHILLRCPVEGNSGKRPSPATNFMTNSLVVPDGFAIVSGCCGHNAAPPARRLLTRHICP